jgi:hypothetical protein
MQTSQHAAAGFDNESKVRRAGYRSLKERRFPVESWHRRYFVHRSQNKNLNSIKRFFLLIARVYMLPLFVRHFSSHHHLYTYCYSFPFALAPSSHLASSSLELKLMLTLFTQCLSSLGFPKRSPLKMCPRCPPQLLHTISVLIMPMPGSARWPTAPGTASQKAGQPQPESNLWFAL